jgi:hypothetical protein
MMRVVRAALVIVLSIVACDDGRRYSPGFSVEVLDQGGDCRADVRMWSRFTGYDDRKAVLLPVVGGTSAHIPIAKGDGASVTATALGDCANRKLMCSVEAGRAGDIDVNVGRCEAKVTAAAK